MSTLGPSWPSCYYFFILFIYHVLFYFYYCPACGEHDKVVFQFGVCAHVVGAFIHLSGFVRAITSTFMHGFNLAQLLSLMSRSAIFNICSDRLAVKVKLEGQMIKWS